MKKLFSFLFAAVTLSVAVNLHAANQTAVPDGNGRASELGAVRVATPTAAFTNGINETRIMRTADNGQSLVYSNVVWRSSMVTSVSSTRTAVVDWDNTTSSSTVYFVGVSTREVNGNVFEVCWSSQPCLFKGFQGPPQEGPMRVRIWDTRGDTATVPAIYDMIIPTGTINHNYEFNQYFSSGLNVHVDRIPTDVSSDPLFIFHFNGTKSDEMKPGGANTP